MLKKSLFGVCLAAMFFSSLFAQDQGDRKRNIYTKIFPIEGIYVCRYGCMVAYRNSTYDLFEIYISNKELSGTTGKAQLVFGRGPEYPYLAVTWIDGQVSRVRIYAVDSPSGTSVLHGTDDELKAKFTDQLEVKP